jgi:hypothetical protein
MDLEFFKIDNIRGFKYTERWLNKNNPEVLSIFYKYVNDNNIDINLSFSNKLWFFINNLKEIPKCYCGSDLKFISVTQGYSKYCSNKCSGNSKETRDLYKKTSLINHGTEYYTQTDEYKHQVIKSNLDKYNVEWTGQRIDVKDKIIETNNKNHKCDYSFQSKIIKDKIRKTKKNKYNNETYNNSIKISQTLKSKYEDKNELESFLNKQKLTNKILYGNEYANRNELIKEKNILNTKKTVNLKYHVDNVFELPFIQNKAKENAKLNYWSKYPELKFINYCNGLHKIHCDKCGEFIINHSLLYTRNRDKHEICTNCNPIDKPYSILELEVNNYIKSIYNGDTITGDKTILNPKHLDIYLPDLKLAFEFDGLYWHNELNKSSNYHLDKTKNCKSKGIKLIHIFEDEWTYNKDIVKSMIKNKIGLTQNKIYARKCKVKEVNIKDSREFLDYNHIQGSVGSTIKLGLYYNDTLVSLMCFTLKKMNNNYDLVRFCNKINTNIIGGASKLLKYFINVYNPTEIISFSDLRWSDGGLYETLGFSFIENIPPSYWYIIQNKRFHKFNFRKNRKLNGNFDLTKTEHELMLDQNIYRIYDCGLKKWILKL